MSAVFTEKSKILNNSICEACGKDFSCGVEIGNCWCFDVNLSTEILAEIGQKYDKCLCPDCLLSEERKFINQHKSPTS